MEHFLSKTNLSITDPNDPKKPVDYNLPTPSPDWLDTEDEEEDLEGVDLQALSSNQNSLPEEMTPELYPNTAESVIYSETLTEGGTSPLFFHPRPGNFISFEVCTDFERERLTRLIQHTDRLCRDLCVKRDSVNEKFVHNQRKMRGNYYKQKAISPPTDLSGITRWAVKTDRLKTKNRADNNRLNVELLNLRRFQTYNSTSSRSKRNTLQAKSPRRFFCNFHKNVGRGLDVDTGNRPRTRDFYANNKEAQQERKFGNKSFKLWQRNCTKTSPHTPNRHRQHTRKQFRLQVHSHGSLSPIFQRNLRSSPPFYSI